MLVVGINGTVMFPNYQFRIVKDLLQSGVGIIPVLQPDWSSDLNLPDLPFAVYESEERARAILQEIVKCYSSNESVYYMPEKQFKAFLRHFLSYTHKTALIDRKCLFAQYTRSQWHIAQSSCID